MAELLRRGVDKRGRDAPFGEKMLLDIGRAVVDIDRCDDMVAWHQTLEDRGNGCQTRAEGSTCSATFQRSQCDFQPIAVRVVIARVEKTTRIAPVRVTLEGG